MEWLLQKNEFSITVQLEWYFQFHKTNVVVKGLGIETFMQHKVTFVWRHTDISI